MYLMQDTAQFTILNEFLSAQNIEQKNWACN